MKKSINNLNLTIGELTMVLESRIKNVAYLKGIGATKEDIDEANNNVSVVRLAIAEKVLYTRQCRLAELQAVNAPEIIISREQELVDKAMKELAAIKLMKAIFG